MKVTRKQIIMVFCVVIMVLSGLMIAKGETTYGDVRDYLYNKTVIDEYTHAKEVTLKRFGNEIFYWKYYCWFIAEDEIYMDITGLGYEGVVGIGGCKQMERFLEEKLESYGIQFPVVHIMAVGQKGEQTIYDVDMWSSFTDFNTIRDNEFRGYLEDGFEYYGARMLCMIK